MSNVIFFINNYNYANENKQKVIVLYMPGNYFISQGDFFYFDFVSLRILVQKQVIAY